MLLIQLDIFSSLNYTNNCKCEADISNYSLTLFYHLTPIPNKFWDFQHNSSYNNPVTNILKKKKKKQHKIGRIEI